MGSSSAIVQQMLALNVSLWGKGKIKFEDLFLVSLWSTRNIDVVKNESRGRSCVFLSMNHKFSPHSWISEVVRNRAAAAISGGLDGSGCLLARGCLPLKVFWACPAHGRPWDRPKILLERLFFSTGLGTPEEAPGGAGKRFREEWCLDFIYLFFYPACHQMKLTTYKLYIYIYMYNFTFGELFRLKPEFRKRWLVKQS